AVALDGSKKYDFIYVQVIDEDPVPVESVSINSGDLNLKIGTGILLNVIVLPDDAGNKNVRWTSGNTDLVSVTQEGYISAVAVGTTTITATARDGSGVSGSINVTVKPENSGPDNPEQGAVIDPPAPGTITAGDINIIEAQGWLESLYVKWDRFAAAQSYNVYYQASGGSGWTKIDDQLIRDYGGYFRADIPGLAAGVYEVKALPVSASGIEGTNPAYARDIGVLAHVRAGFAFNAGVVPGAYKADGTPKDGARILYVTDQNKDTVSLSVMTSATKEQVFTGLDEILETGMQKGYENRPLIVRFIGKINEKQGSPFTDNEGSLMIKDNGRNAGFTSFITLEGIGDDATAYGWGIRTSRATNVEIRNLAIMLSDTTQKDSIELQNSNFMWVHNCDFFYGMPGTDSDQHKGDGSIDIKICSNVTLSYNHFWDTGKTSLLGNATTEAVGYLTYHHNWFDHSDSRHPRVRIHRVHVYSNYYDGTGKYGMGATLGSSIFSEANYFRNSKKPMLISMQGTDTKSGTDTKNGTFSSEDGGIIKSYNNYMDAATAATWLPWSAANSVEFDSYEVKSADEQVPSTVKAKQGGATYDNNFLTYSYIADSPETAKTNVTTWAGRYWGGDFKFAFNNATDDALTDDPMPELKNALLAYTSKLVAVQGSN
ncbi:MAG: Ig-like domain-containing protein, partial [Treponema sp.]|nr:Ig-like domain-containing protein [Treponema sp.]